MEKSLTKKAIDFFNIEAAMNGVSNAPGFKFQILIAKNTKVLKDELDIIREKSKICPEFEAVQEKTKELQKSFANKEKNGEPKIISEHINGRMSQRYDVSEEKLPELEKAFAEFWELEENKIAREKQEQIYRDYEEYLKNEDITLRLFTIPSSCAPEEFFIKEENMEKLQYFVNTCFELIDE